MLRVDSSEIPGRILGEDGSQRLRDLLASVPSSHLAAAVRDIARIAGVATPEIDTLFGLARLHARVLGLYPDAAATH